MVLIIDIVGFGGQGFGTLGNTELGISQRAKLWKALDTCWVGQALVSILIASITHIITTPVIPLLISYLLV